MMIRQGVSSTLSVIPFEQIQKTFASVKRAKNFTYVIDTRSWKEKRYK